MSNVFKLRPEEKRLIEAMRQIEFERLQKSIQSKPQRMRIAFVLASNWTPKIEEELSAILTPAEFRYLNRIIRSALHCA